MSEDSLLSRVGAGARRAPTEEGKKRAPRTRVKRGGKVNRRLKALADMYLAGHPGQEVRFVYHPQHKPDLSNVVSRQTDGWRLCYVKDLGDDVAEILPGMKSEEMVRVGDAVMMFIAADIRQEYREEMDAINEEEKGRVEEDFYAAIDEIEANPEHKPRPRGRSVIEEVEKEVDVPASHKAE